MPYGNRFYQGGLDLNQVLAPVNTMVGWDQAAAQLAETKRRTDLSEAAQQETMRVSQIQHGTGLPGQAGFVPGTEQQKIGLMREELAKKPPIPKFQQVINPSDVVMSKRMTAKQFGEGALKVLEPMFNTINEVAAANPQTTNWDAYQASKSSYAGQKAEMAGRGEKYMMSDEFLKLKPEQQEGFKNLYNQMMTDPDGSVFYDSGVFRQTVESKRQEEAIVGAKINKEINVANELDTILGGLFKGYYTDPKVRRAALDWYATPEGSKTVQTAAAQYSQNKQAPQFTPVVTTGGIMPFATKGPGAGTFRPVGTGEEAPSKPLPEGAVKEFGALAGLIGTTQKIESLFKPAFVGPVAGRYYGVKEKFIDMPEDQVQFYSYVRDAKDALLRARSGAQINEQEYARLVKFLPDENLPEKNFISRLKRFQDQIGILQTEKAKTYSGQGYKIDISTGRTESKESQNRRATDPKKIGRFTVEVE
jgi:hypothetical protein